MLELTPLPLTAARFAPYGEVIDVARSAQASMNDARFDRFDELCTIDVVDGEVGVGIVRSRSATRLPYSFDLIERHPLGSQAFIPLSPCPMVIVVGVAGGPTPRDDLQAFVTNGTQGINYRRGTWHMPLISLRPEQRYLVIDRRGDGPNCDLHTLDDKILLKAPDTL